MRRTLITLSLLLMAACAPGPTGQVSGPNDASTILPTPTPIVDKAEFTALFSQLCLVTPHEVSNFQRTARRLGLKQTRGEGRPSDLYISYEWQAPKDNDGSPLTIKVGAGDIIYELQGNPRNLEKRQLSCTVTAYLPPLDPAARTDLMRTVDALRPIAKALDFKPNASGYQVKPGDIDVNLQPSEMRRRVDSQIGAECPRENPCWQPTPYVLTLEVVTERSP